ncbi:MAG: mechanosensitive ion channel family protein [Alphaproteobacteria bacterium]
MAGFSRCVCAIVALVLVATVVWSADSNAQLPDLGGFSSGEESTLPDAPIVTDQSDKTDAAIRERLLDIYANLDGLEDVSVSVDAGIVSLSGSVLEPDAAARAEAFATRTEGVIAVKNSILVDQSVSLRVGQALDKIREFGVAAVGMLPLLVVAIVVVFVFWLLGKFVASRQRPWERMSSNAFIRRLVRQVVVAVFLFAGLLLALDILNATAFLGTILGAAGIIGLAVGFAVRDTIENFVASILLSLRQPFAPNDHVIVDGNEGRVVRLTSRATTLLTFSGNHVRIPNAQVFKAVITNYTSHPHRRFEFEVGVDVDDDPNVAQAIALQVLQGMESVVAKPDPVTRIKKLGDSNVVLWIAGWMDQREHDFSKVRSEALRLVKAAFEDAQITMPEPIYNVRVETVEKVPVRSSPSASPQQLDTAAAEASQEEGDTSRDDDIERKVDEERALGGDDDLLDDNAPRE